MRLLLDTVTFLWITSGSSELSEVAAAAFVNADNSVFLSSVSSWEIAVKHGLGKLPLPTLPEKFVPDERVRHGIESLPLEEAATLHLHRLPSLHRDPFDRMLICQAIANGLTIVTPDQQFSRYAVPVLW